MSISQFLAPSMLWRVATSGASRPDTTDVPELAVPNAAAVSAALGSTPRAARRIAARASEHQRDMLAIPRERGAGVALTRLRRALGTRILPPLPGGAGPTVVALPLTRAAVAWIAERAQEGRAMLVLRSPASAAFLQPYLAGYPRARLSAVSEMLAHARAAVVDGDAPVYVTFPEHVQAAAGTSCTATLLRSQHQVSILEALLLARGVRLLAANVEPGGSVLGMVECPVPVAGGTLSATMLDAVATWLAEHLSGVIAAAPDELLTWGYLERQRSEAVERSRVQAVSNVKAFLRMWRAIGTGLPDEVYGWSVAELDRLRGDACLVAPRAAASEGGAA